jgi:hypothetical protein
MPVSLENHFVFKVAKIAWYLPKAGNKGRWGIHLHIVVVEIF